VNDPRFNGPPHTWPVAGKNNGPPTSGLPIELPDEFPHYPRYGLPDRRGEGRAPGSAFGRLAFGGALGQRSILRYDATKSGDQSSPVDILTIQGDDLDALQLNVTLGAPQVVPVAFADLSAVADQDVRMTQDNFEVKGSGNFPGTVHPIEWPPFEAIIEWGVGGANFRAFCDFVNGQTVNLTASWLRVYGAVAIQEGAGISGTSAAYALSAFVGPGWTRSNAQKTVYAGSIDAATEGNPFPVPPFAKKAYLIGCDNSAEGAVTSGYLRFWQSADGITTGKNTGTFFQSGNQPIGFPVPAGSQYFTVLSGASSTTLYSVVFDLSI